MTYVRTSLITDPADPTRQSEFDTYFSAPVIVDAAHHEIHEGAMFSLFVSESAISDTETIEIFVTTPDTATPQKRAHLIAETSGSLAYTFTIQEGPTYSSGGAAGTAYNRNRGSSTTTGMQDLYTGNTADNIVTGGSPTTIWTKFNGSGRDAGGSGRDDNEWVLAPDTSYLFQLTSSAGAGTFNDVYIGLIWYEHTDD